MYLVYSKTIGKYFSRVVHVIGCFIIEYVDGDIHFRASVTDKMASRFKNWNSGHKIETTPSKCKKSQNLIYSQQQNSIVSVTKLQLLKHNVIGKLWSYE